MCTGALIQTQKRRNKENTRHKESKNTQTAVGNIFSRCSCLSWSLSLNMGNNNNDYCYYTSIQHKVVSFLVLFGVFRVFIVAIHQRMKPYISYTPWPLLTLALSRISLLQSGVCEPFDHVSLR